MATSIKKLEGVFLSMDFDRHERFDWKDDKGNVKPIESLVGLMEFGDGTRDWVKIGFPRDESFRAPQLMKGTRYIIPVLLSIDKKRNEVRYTIRTDMAPFEAPEIQ
jgi:hypothetical protein